MHRRAMLATHGRAWSRRGSAWRELLGGLAKSVVQRTSSHELDSERSIPSVAAKKFTLPFTAIAPHINKLGWTRGALRCPRRIVLGLVGIIARALSPATALISAWDVEHRSKQGVRRTEAVHHHFEPKMSGVEMALFLPHEHFSGRGHVCLRARSGSRTI